VVFEAQPVLRAELEEKIAIISSACHGTRDDLANVGGTDPQLASEARSRWGLAATDTWCGRSTPRQHGRGSQRCGCSDELPTINIVVAVVVAHHHLHEHQYVANGPTSVHIDSHNAPRNGSSRRCVAVFIKPKAGEF
jgi:hypothetical protein